MPSKSPTKKLQSATRKELKPDVEAPIKRDCEIR